jgi:hypothetical protein
MVQIVKIKIIIKCTHLKHKKVYTFLIIIDGNSQNQKKIETQKSVHIFSIYGADSKNTKS